MKPPDRKDSIISSGKYSCQEIFNHIYFFCKMSMLREHCLLVKDGFLSHGNFNIRGLVVLENADTVIDVDVFSKTS